MTLKELKNLFTETERSVAEARDELRKTAGALIRDERNAAGLSQKAVARQAGFSNNYLCAVENGKRRISYEQVVHIVLSIQRLR